MTLLWVLSQWQKCPFQIRLHKFQAVFIDAFYSPNNPNERDKFAWNVEKLWQFSIDAVPFQCKDIKAALNDLMEAKKNITSLRNELIQKEEEILSETILEMLFLLVTDRE